MIIADITVQTSSITVALHDKLPLGAAGLKVRFHFSDPAWEPLSKTAVFRNRNQTLDVALTEDWALIPHELLGKVMDVIDVGIYGTDGSQLLAIPTVWGRLGTVESGAQPSGDPATDPTLPYWAQIKEQVDRLEGNIINQENLEDALAKAKENGDFDGPPGPKGDPGAPGADGYTPVKGLDYWTAAEQNQIIAAASAHAIDTVGRTWDIVCQARGDSLLLQDSAHRKLHFLNFYGKTIQNGTPVPESPVPLNSAGSGGAICAVISSGNLCDPHGFSNPNCYTVDQEGFVHFTNPNTETGDIYRMYPDYYLPVPKGTYTVTVEMDTYIEHYVGSNNIDYTKPLQSPKSHVLTDTEKICIMFAVPRSTSFKFRITIYPGSNPQPYQSYAPPQTVSLPTPNGLPGIPVSSGGNYTDSNGQLWLCDEMDFTRGVYIQRVDKITADMVAAISEYSVNGQGYPCINMMLSSHLPENHPVLSNCYQQIPMTTSVSHGTMKNWGSQITIYDTRFTGKSHGISLLKEANFLLLLKKVTPVETPISEDQLLALENAYTCYPYSLITNDAGAGMAAEYVADSKHYIDNKFAELSAALANTV